MHRVYLNKVGNGRHVYVRVGVKHCKRMGSLYKHNNYGKTSLKGVNKKIPADRVCVTTMFTTEVTRVTTASMTKQIPI